MNAWSSTLRDGPSANGLRHLCWRYSDRDECEKNKKFKLKPTFRTKFIGFSSQPVRQYYYLFFLPVRSHSNSFHPFRWFLFQFGCRSYFTDSQKKVDQRQRIERTGAEKKSCWKAACVRLYGVESHFTFKYFFVDRMAFPFVRISLVGAVAAIIAVAVVVAIFHFSLERILHVLFTVFRFEMNAQ